MTSDELPTAIAELEHYLTDVWPWADLYELGRSYNGLDHLGEDRRAMREIDVEITQCLVDSYRRAIDQIDERLASLTSSPVLDLLIERLCERLEHVTGGSSFSHMTAQLYHEGGGITNEPGWTIKSGDHILSDPTAKDYSGNWACVARDLAFYGSKVIAHLRSYLVERRDHGGAKGATTDRIRWLDSASRLAYLFHELEAAGYISPPKRSGEPNWSAVARILDRAFVIGKEDEPPVTLTSLYQALKPQGDIDRRGGKAAFRITPRRV